MIFLTPAKRNYRLVMKVHKTDKEGEVLQEPIYIFFEDGVFETVDEEKISFIKARPNFGHDFFESPEVPKTHGYQGHSVGISKMDNPNQNNEVETLKKQIENLTMMVTSLTEKLNAPKDEKVSDSELQKDGVCETSELLVEEKKKVGRPKNS